AEKPRGRGRSLHHDQGPAFERYRRRLTLSPGHAVRDVWARRTPNGAPGSARRRAAGTCRCPSSTTARSESRIKLGRPRPFMTSVCRHGHTRRTPPPHAANSAAYGGFVMVSRGNGELKRSVFSALAAMVAAAIPSLVALPAQAETPSGSTA